MPLTVLSVAYPLAAVASAGGGAEQILSHIDAGLEARGHRSLVIAQDGSQVAGRLIRVPPPPGVLSHVVYAQAERRHLEVIERVLASEQVDVVHLHGVDFYTYLPRTRQVPTLVTLHLPRSWYQPEARDLDFPGVRFVCVSRSQARSWPAHHLEVIDNGVPLRELRSSGQPPRLCPAARPHLPGEGLAPRARCCLGSRCAGGPRGRPASIPGARAVLPRPDPAPAGTGSGGCTLVLPAGPRSGGSWPRPVAWWCPARHQRPRQSWPSRHWHPARQWSRLRAVR